MVVKRLDTSKSTSRRLSTVLSSWGLISLVYVERLESSVVDTDISLSATSLIFLEVSPLRILLSSFSTPPSLESAVFSTFISALTELSGFGKLSFTFSRAGTIAWSSFLACAHSARTDLISACALSEFVSFIFLRLFAEFASFLLDDLSTSPTDEVTASTLLSATLIASSVSLTTVFVSPKIALRSVLLNDLLRSCATSITPSNPSIVFSTDFTADWAESIWFWRFWNIFVPSFFPCSITVPKSLFTRLITVVTNDSLTSVWIVWTTLSVIFVAIAFFFSFE